MWGEWGQVYWGRKEEVAAGIVVVFAWASVEERHLRQYVKLYGSLGWNSLVCHASFLTIFFPEKATSLAHSILEQLIKDVKMRPLPIVFMAFSGGSKACMYKVLQIMEGKCKEKLLADDNQLVKDAISGQIYDSSPIDFTSDLGARFMLHVSVAKMSQPPRVVSWVAKALSSGMDNLFFSGFEAQRTEYWQALYSSVELGPFLIFCSEDDELAPSSVICNFAQHLLGFGADVKTVKWCNSPHVGHFKLYPDEYKDSVAELFGKARAIYCQRMKHVAANSQIPESVFDLHKVAMNSNESLRKVATGPNDHFFLPSSTEYRDTKDGGSSHDEQKRGVFDSENPPGIDAHGVLGKILFDVCVPKNIEGWDIKPVGSFNSRPGLLNPLKFMRRSKL